MFYRRILPHLQRDNKRHFVTFCTRDHWTLPNQARDIVLSSSLHDHGVRYDMHAAVVMPDHVHLIFTPLIHQREPRVWLLPEILDAVKGASAHLINKKLSRGGSIWQEESFDHVLRGSEQFRDKVHYILENPVRRGLVERWRDYPWLWVRPFENAYQPGRPGAAAPTQAKPKPH